MTIAFRSLAAVFIVCLLVLCGGCSVPSLNALATPETTVFEPALLGDWKQKDTGDDGLQVRVLKGDAKTCEIVLNPVESGAAKSQVDSDGPVNLKLTGSLVKLGEQRFVDLTLSKGARDKLGDRYALLAIPVHQIVKISIEPDRLTIWDLDDGWIKDLVKQNPTAIEHSMVDGDSPVITAPTAAFQKFIAAHATDEKAWTDPQVYVRVKPAAPVKP